jgi:hypothetical protein
MRDNSRRRLGVRASLYGRYSRVPEQLVLAVLLGKLRDTAGVLVDVYSVHAETISRREEGHGSSLYQGCRRSVL